MYRILIVSLSLSCVVIFGVKSEANAQPRHNDPYLETAVPDSVGMSAEKLAAIDPLVEQAIAEGKTPGAVVLIGRGGKIAYQRAFGHRQLEPNAEPMTIDTVFDLASLTKPIATATSVMVLLERGQVRLRDSAALYLPGFEQNEKGRITLTQLLTHQGGLIPDNPLSDYTDGREEAVRRMLALETVSEPGTRFAYTDVGFIALGEMVHAVDGRNLAQFSREEIFAPLGMRDTGYLPADELKARSAATERRDGEWMKGEVHDPRAYAMDGIAGHAGLFSTAPDLAIYAQMMLSGGEHRGRRVLSAKTIEVMTDAYEVSRGTRGLGWDKRSPYSSNRGELMSEKAFGHGGFTGTAIWMDPGHDLFVIFLSTRLHPDGVGSINSLAGKIGTIAVAAIQEKSSGETSGAISRWANEDRWNANHNSAAHQTLTGLDVLENTDFELLKDKRVGLITNHTGLSRDGLSNVQLFDESNHVELSALFSPEHGFEGSLDVAKISDSSDRRTGLHIYSLYGETRRPTPEMLDEIDVMVFDIQDIGARFYTYVSTMGEAMKACAENGKAFVVLDRPNPIGADVTAGPVLDDGKQSFVGFHTISVQHGMTTGELALMMRDEMKLDLDLRVVRCENWNRSMRFDETGLRWTNPSPNMRNLTQAMLYPGIGLLETTNLSVGRGTDTPFEIFGAPWIDEKALAMDLNQRRLPGVSFVPIQFQPESSVFAGEVCGGINIVIKDHDSFDAIRVGFEVATAIRAMYPDQWQIDRYNRLLGDDNVLEAVKAGRTATEILAIFQTELSEFKERRQKYLLYD